MSSRVLVTGATGFVGTTLCGVLSGAGYRVRAALRADRELPNAQIEKAVVGDIGRATDWQAALEGVEMVVHAAARAHVLRDGAGASDLYMEANGLGTERLAEAAAAAGVRRFIYVSSVKVNGEETSRVAFTSSDEPCPRDDYGRSKWLGEQSLMRVARQTGLHADIVRPPLVYGPGVKANFLRLMRWVDREYPLPLGAVDNRRSLVSVWNLCDLIRHLLQGATAAPGPWLVSDGWDLSTPEIIRRLANRMGRRARLYRVPTSLLLLAGALMGRGPDVKRLCSSLEVDIAPTRDVLGWRPPVDIDEGLERTVKWYLREART